ncbi:MAG: hypothetical protein A3B89_01295 [Candidatus Buchananbacteria bacterium RIFCSPHIGHO2_02_FULL_40_13]|uniref:Glycosyl transferase family 1 n=1 Tax=Candidatus Buchananbacteria bacterium RIFCSPLOWO2_01_FULL_39_33 TaxID=1797543 RepID=A0A1G1YNU4_9BACT|nr:MAG: hypothetical protein A2820_03450 [Candidatus Buchananbacteria bacterium RIFCSPHIGHO2_01_FULL_40_35]OGY50125.1 MAG: hypothetical protein A3B89_01295 [Candidatus Buchananbacteria bacterium RIFCSPHIGHO2_02_FULL_40_13]OGY53107.1 MAG: hypothetical protein A3A02_00110 [Candidatus Buchananbacteria bacterium RIFCSPLOWO2_01_FULL_39_33]
MKIGLDARLYGSQHGGIGRYTENLIKQLELQTDQNTKLFIFLSKDNFNDYQPSNKNFQKVLADFKVYGLKEQLLFPPLLKKYQLDLVHFPHFNAPIFYRGKFIVTIHDLIISHYPNSRTTTLNPLVYKIKLFFYKVIIKNAAQKAKKIIAVSKYTKKDIIKLLKIEPAKIIVTYEGVDLPKTSQMNCNELKTKLGISKDFLLYVGSAYPHKNLEKLISAFKIIDNPNLQLVLVGKKNYFYNRLAKEIKKEKLENNVILTDYLSDDELTGLYKSAKLYVFPSLIEGFGLPPLEAQSYSLPVVSSNSTCLPEILGESAVYFDPDNIQTIVKVITNTLNNPELLASLKVKGLENVKRYSWDDCAQKTLKEYQQN